jgi:hypothetical protein
MTWRIVENRAGLPNIGTVSATQDAPLGTRVRAVHETYGEGEFVYLKGVASTAFASWVTFAQDDHSTALLNVNPIGPVAVATAAIVADRFGWYQIYGKGVGLVAPNFADNGTIFAIATAGTVDDAGAGGDRIKNARGASAIGTPAAGQAEMELWYPYADDIAD